LVVLRNIDFGNIEAPWKKEKSWIAMEVGYWKIFIQVFKANLVNHDNFQIVILVISMSFAPTSFASFQQDSCKEVYKDQ
jgi:hypothetical protein